MKYALLVGVSDTDPAEPFDATPSLAAMESLLTGLGGWSVTRLEGPKADRGGILAALDRLEAAAEGADAVLFYFFGHGGVVELEDQQPPLGGRPVFYLVAARKCAQWYFTGILDVELSMALARIEGRCANVSAIIDSCYSAQIVRGPIRKVPESPDWVHALADEQEPARAQALLHPISHPHIPRLCAASSLRYGFGDAVPGGNLGRLTSLVCELVGEVGGVERLTWAALADRVRERAIWRLGCEEQWVSLAGPSHRYLFSTRSSKLRATVGFVPHADAKGQPLPSCHGGWIRAGLLQGVEMGDRWGLVDVLVDERGEAQCLARLRVVALDLNRARLEPEGAGKASVGSSAVLLEAARRDPVACEDPELRARLVQSPWLRPAEEGEESKAVVRAEADGALGLSCAWAAFAGLRVRADAEGRGEALERLEDWARARRLTQLGAYVDEPRARARLSVAPSPRARARPLRGDVRLRAGTWLSARVESLAKAQGLFVSVVVIDGRGRARLLDDAEPDGIELLPGETRPFGVHPGRGRGGLALSWPGGTDPSAPLPVYVVVLASRRPIPLRHLIPSRLDLGIPDDRPRRRRAVSRAIRAFPRPKTGPEVTRDWSVEVLEFSLDHSGDSSSNV